jgi:hypothetical protein
MAQPFDREWSGITDASGNLSITLMPLAAYDSALVIAGQASGNPLWSIFKNGNFLLPGAGSQIAVGPLYFKAKETLTIKVAGALPLTQIAGTIWGTQSTSDGTDLPVLHPQTSGSVPGFNQDILLGTVVDGGGTTLKDFQIPPGAQTIRVVPDGGQRAQGIIVAGKTSNSDYLFIPTPSIAVVYAAPIDPSIDPIVTITFQGGGIGNQTLYVSVSLAAEAVQVVAPAGEELAVNITKVNSSVGSGQDTTAGAANSLAVVPAKFYQPTPWQSPTLSAKFIVTPPAGGNTSIIAAPGAGLSIYLHYLRYAHLASAATNGDFRDASGVQIIDAWAQNAGAPLGPFPFDCKGLRLPANQAFQCNNVGGVVAASIYGGVLYTVAA